MARRRQAEKRRLLPDPKYKDEKITKFINYLMLDGKKSVSEKTFYGMMDELGEKINENPLDIFNKSIDNVKPLLEVRSRRVGGATYQVPVEVSSRRQYALAFRWIIESARKRKGISMKSALVNEIMDAYNNSGAAIKKREETHRMAEANRAFAHYKW